MSESIEAERLVPKKLDNYFKFGAYDDLEKIIASNMFLPVFITGLSRSGKTCMVEQACANLNREMVRANITEETDEDDMIGGFRMIDGNTIWFDGPTVVAILKGAILLLDEIDLGSYKLMCLQPILEGSPLYLKRTGRVIRPAPGFNIIATANTKGQGDARGKFGGTQLLNEAFLDRFSITIEHHYPNQDVEKNIIRSYLPKNGNITALDDEFVDYLVQWASNIRKSFHENAASDLISTGRLIHIIKTYLIFKNPFIAVRFGITRFDESMKEAFWEMFQKEFPYEEDELTDTGLVNNKKFIKRVSDEMDLSEFNTKYKMPPKKP